MLYFVTFINDYKRHISIAFMKTKKLNSGGIQKVQGSGWNFYMMEILWIDNGV